MPSIFVGHGSPMNAIADNALTQAWERLGEIFKPKAIVGISAHYHTQGIKIDASISPRQIYDMYGFPNELYELRFQPSGDEKLANKICEILKPFNATLDSSWGIDHGLWSVLCKMYKNAEIPLVAMSIDLNATLKEQLKIGEILSGLRDEGIMILASGNIVHNLAIMDYGREGYGFDFAKSFDEFIMQCILKRDFENLLAFRERAEAKKCCHTLEHFLPLLNAIGASKESDEITVFNQVYNYGSVSMTSYIFDANKHKI